MGRKEYEELRKDELLDKARELGLTSLSRLRKDEIVDLLLQAERRAARRKAASKKTSKATASARTIKKTASKKAATTKAVTKKATSKKTAETRATAKKTASKKTAETRTATKKSAATKIAPSRAGAPAHAEKRNERRAASTRSTVSTSSDVATSPAANRPATALPPSDRQIEQAVQQPLAGEAPTTPEAGGVNRIRLLARDPSWFYCYWDLSAEYVQAARDAGGKALALRLYDMTQGAEYRTLTYETTCDEWARAWFLPVAANDRVYIAEIGFLDDRNSWLPLARSNTARSLLDGQQASPPLVTRTVSHPIDQPLRTTASPQPTPALEASDTADWLNAQLDSHAYDVQADRVRGSSATLLAGERLAGSRLPGSRSSAALADRVAGSRVAGSRVAGSRVAGSRVAGSRVAGSRVAGSRVAGSRRGFQTLIGWADDTTPTLGHTLTLGGKTDAFYPSLPGPGDHAVAVAAELVLVGRTNPTNRLSISGNRIPVGPDGAFSLRIPFEEGLGSLTIESEDDRGSVESLRVWFGTLNEANRQP
ncbi:MAG: DUF4912 domain-containing protein [Deltaproteobacteria bacterium]|nr:DUF4912 domain-containing protein [Deltaproteobacteria bacterium]